MKSDEIKNDELLKDYIRKVKECDKLRKTLLDVKSFCTNIYGNLKDEYDAICEGERNGCSWEERMLLDILSLIKKSKLI